MTRIEIPNTIQKRVIGNYIPFFRGGVKNVVGSWRCGGRIVT